MTKNMQIPPHLPDLPPPYYVGFGAPEHPSQGSKENIMPKNMQSLPSIFSFLTESENKPVVQYGVQDCYNICDQRHPGNDVGSLMLRNACAFGCRTTNWFDAPEHPSQGSTATANDIKSELENIGDSFYSLADSFSVL